MSLWGTLNVGKTALAVNQAALQTVGNNVANAGNADYSRQRVNLQANRSEEYRNGIFLGTGVDVKSIERQVDDSLNQRLRAAMSDAEGGQAGATWLGRLEAVFNELSDEDISTGLSQFFSSWSELANKPQDMGLRQVVLQNGDNIATQLQAVRAQLGGLGDDVDQRVSGYAGEVDELMGKVADLNQKIAVTEGGSGGANNTLRDERDAVLNHLATLVNISTNTDQTGMVNVSIGQDVVVLGTTNRGITTRIETDANGETYQQLVIRDTGAQLNVTGGLLGATAGARDQIAASTGKVDGIAGALIFELNKIHSAGQGLEGFSSITSRTPVADTTVALNSKEADLPFAPTNGSFVVRVKDKATGAVTSTLINVNLDGTGTQTSLDSLVASLDGIDDISASATGGLLNIRADSSAVEISFAQDSSGVLASLGVGGFFTGKDARDIAVDAQLQGNPRLLAAAKNGQPADNNTAKLIAQLETSRVGTLDGKTMKETYEASVNEVASKVSGAKTQADASAAIRDTLQTQREAVSGVSLDEEAISLMKYQRAYQGAARVIQVTDEMLQTILDMAR
jgi:flagellar hook-associated protein 1